MPSTNFRPGLENSGVCTLRAFQKAADAPTANAHRASNPHTATHHTTCARSEATTAAPKAVIPIITPPHPGTAVNEAALSMVSRMKRKSSMAWAGMGAALECRERTGPAQVIGRLYRQGKCLSSTLWNKVFAPLRPPARCHSECPLSF